MSNGYFILIVEDDDAVAEMLREYLQREGYVCERAAQGDQVLDLVRSCPPDLILLDRVLPGMTGDEVIQRLRSDPRSQAIPVIMLTGKSAESDELVGLALGADDYIAKPFAPKLLLARIAVHLRRRNAAERQDERLPISSIALDRSQPQVFVDKTPVQLTVTEYKILATLIAARGHVLDRRQLISMVFGKKAPSDERALEGQVEGLRRKMGAAAGYIQVVADEGYAFCGPIGQRPPA